MSTNMTNTISVIGAGVAHGEPDAAFVDLGVQVIDTSLSAAFENASATMNKIISTIEALGIDKRDIQTSGLSVYQQERHNPDQSREITREFHVSNSVKVTVRQTHLIEGVINGSIGAGANTIHGLRFGKLEAKTLEAEARAAAVEDARARAEQLASALGARVGKALIVNEGSSDFSAPMPKARMMMASADSSMPVSEGQLQVSVQISITFELLAK